MRHFYTFLTSFFICSCISDIDVPGGTDKKDAQECFPITVSVDSPQSRDMTRSSFSSSEVDRVTDLNIYVYHQGVLLEAHSRYFPDTSSLMLSFPYGVDGFNIYMLGNVGKVDPPYDEDELSELRHLIGSYDDFRSCGAPVAECYKGYRKGTLAHFPLKRLLGQYNISMRTSAEDAEYEIKDVRMLNCALDVFPFASDAKATVFTRGGEYGQAAVGDVLTGEDVSRLNGGEAVSLYFVENLQGVLLPDNKDRRKKIPSSLADEVASRCTYIEITADITTPSARYSNARYRFYLGQDMTTDFSVRRNTLYDIVLDFTQDMVCEEEWRIEADAPQVEQVVLSKEEVNVVKGIEDHVIVTGPRVEIVSDGDEDDFGCYLSDVFLDGIPCQKLSVYADRDITGLCEWDKVTYPSVTGMVRLQTVERYNGKPLATLDVAVNVYDKAFPVLLRMTGDGRSNPYRLEALTPAPVSFPMDMNATAIAEFVHSGTSSRKGCKSSGMQSGVSREGWQYCSVGFSALDGSGADAVYFRNLDVRLAGVPGESCKADSFYMGDGGEVYWGPGSSYAPKKFKDLSDDGELDFVAAHTCSKSGCIYYKITAGGQLMFQMAPKAVTCQSSYTTGTSNSLTVDISEYNTGKNIPFYLINGALEYTYPVTIRNEAAQYMKDTARKSIMYEMPGPGRDLFYPNGSGWGGTSDGAPARMHKFGYTAGLMKQFFGNLHTWQVYQDYECDFFMTVNGCTAWPGASKSFSGFILP